MSANLAPTSTTRIGFLGVTDHAGLVDVFAGDAEIGSGGGTNIVLVGNDVCADRTGRDLTPLLRGVVFIGEAALGTGLDIGNGRLFALDGALFSLPN